MFAIVKSTLINIPTYKRIGILGGLSYESTADLYELIMEKHTQKFKNAFYPEVVIFSVNFEQIINLQDAEDLNVKAYVGELSVGLQALVRADADLIVIAANTPHMFFEELEKTVSVPMRSIVRATLDVALRQNYSKLLLLGTKRTMSTGFFQQEFSPKGIQLLVPSPSEQNTINTIIFKDLVRGAVNQTSKRQILDIAKRYDVEGIILGCTELSMIIKSGDVNLELLDTLDIQAEDILNLALVP